MALKTKRNVLLHYHEPHSQVAEEFEYIKQNIEFLSYERGCSTILVTSPEPGDGKSSIAANLAISLAKTGKKVLLIDSHIKNPSLHSLFGFKNTAGLVNILSDQKTLEETVNKTPIENLKVLTSGPLPYDTAKLLKSSKMDDLLKKASFQFAYVVIDTPSILDDSTAKILSAKCDGSILVLKNGKTEDSIALEAKNALELSNARILGIIFNRKKKRFSFKRRTK
ncbi:CpsD/CapB family tyrosine-protein kinase [Evansella clarkii]|uniref:CpsD/CapB family tyrosine-protein kinase n=1 Tax=Evansella clarkii TaxID=79879 RepID=UPI0014300506|nr:CpsD/CapB family tyrosine-protein kinase [Evansella clarkii]